MTISERPALEAAPALPENTAPPVAAGGKKRLAFMRNDPMAVCAKCAGDRTDVFYHSRGVIQQSHPAFPCYSLTINAYALGIETLGEHLCKRCITCSFTWMEEVSSPGPEYQLVAIGDDDLYDDEESEGENMSIRKTGAVTGAVLGVEGDGPDEALVKEGSADTWDGSDETALADENTAADQDE